MDIVDHRSRRTLCTYFSGKADGLFFSERKPGFNEILYNIRTTVHQSLGCTLFEAHFARKSTTIWRSFTRSASSENLKWNNVLISRDWIKRYFPRR